MSEVFTRAGRPLGKRATETRTRLLDALAFRLDTDPWRTLSPIRVAADAGVSPATFYELWPAIEDAVFDVARARIAERSRVSHRLRAVLLLLAVEGSRTARRLHDEAREIESEKPGEVSTQPEAVTVDA